MNNMNAIIVDRPHALNRPACEACGGQTRLTGIEPHPTQARTDLWTYQCLACDAVQAAVMPVETVDGVKPAG